MVKTKSIYDPASEEDGLRVLVTRYWPRGVKKEAVDKWMRALGPEADLIKAYKSGTVAWPEFKKRYKAEFSSDEKKSLLKELKSLIKSTKENVTLICICRDEAVCHRKVLKEML